MTRYIRNIPIEQAFALAGEVEYLPGQVVSKTIAQNDALSLTVFAFDEGEEIGTHASHGDALVTALDGAGRVTIDGRSFSLGAGESILMPAGKPHAIFASERFKMFLVVVFPPDKE